MLLIVFASSVFSQRRTRPPLNSKKSPSATDTNPVLSKDDNYSAKPFDLNVEILPHNYLGHDPKLICDALLKIASSTKKDEFETTEAYQNRIRDLQVKPLVGDLSTNSFLVFTYNPLNVRFNADKARLEVIVRLEEQLLAFDKPERLLSLDYRQTLGQSYIGQNTYGAKTVVQKEHAESWALMFTNYANLGSTKHRDEQTDDSLITRAPRLYDAFINALEMDVDTAKIAKDGGAPF